MQRDRRPASTWPISSSLPTWRPGGRVRTGTREQLNSGPGAAEDGVVAASRRPCDIFLVSCSR